MNIPTTNIVVAFDRTTMERLFSSGATYKSLVSELSDGLDNALLFDNVGNPNFISLEHSLNLGGGFKIVISFIDPKNEFEKRFLTDNPARIIESLSSSSTERTEGFLTDKPDDVKQSQKYYSKKYVAQYKTELEKSLGSKEIYVAYGTGNNLDLWSGPHRTVLTAADISVDGARKITITLTPTPNSLNINNRRGAYNEKVNLNLIGLKMRYAGESQEIRFNSEKCYDPTEYLDGESRYENQISEEVEKDRKLLQDLGFEELSKKLEKFDFHCMVVDAIRSYVQKATSNKNVIVLLPNLNITCRKAINDSAKRFNIIDETFEGLAIAGEALESVTPLIPGPGGFFVSRLNDLTPRTQTEQGRTEMFVQGTLESFGLRLHSGDRKDAERLQKETIPYGQIAAKAQYEKYPTAEAAIEGYYNDRFFTAVIDKTDRQLPDHMGVLQEIFNRIQKLSHESYKMSSLAVLNETDLNVMKHWNKRSNAEQYTFAGYDRLEGDSAIIVGDLALIKEYLYAGVDLQKKEQDIASLKARAGAEYVLKNKLGFISEGLRAVEENSKEKSATVEDYLAAAAVQVPLHPLDNIALNNITYNKQIKKVLNPVLKGSGAFGDISYLPDDFKYQDKEFTDLEKKYIEENGIPVFRYNTQNPNTLELKFKFAPIYFGNLKAGYQKEIKRLASAVAEGVLPTGIGTFPIRERGQAIAYLRMKGYSHGLGDEDKQKIKEQLALTISPELVKSLNLDSAEAAADFYALYIEDLELNNLHGLVLVDQELPGSPQTILADFTEDMFRKAIQMSITTLPLFHISRTSTLGSPCLFLGQDQPIMQSKRPELSALNKFFSGLYKIMGFKHTITAGAATSEFKLVKNAPKFELEENNETVIV